jgi:hypothetical protein
MAKTVRSRKNKGKRLQNKIRDLILESFPVLENDDVLSTTMGEAGIDVKLSPAARKLFPYSIECKNQERLGIWSAIEQAESNKKQDTELALFFTKNHSKIYVTIEAEHFFNIIDRISSIDNK